MNPASPTSVDPITATITVRNTGTASTDTAFSVRIVLYDRTTDTYLADREDSMEVGTLAANTSTTVQFTIDPIAAGDYAIIADADVFDVVDESNEDDNVYQQDIAVTAGTQTITTVEVAAPYARVATGGTAQLTATAKDQNDNDVAGATFTWSSLDTSVATVSSTGVVTGVAAGTADITATESGGVADTLGITVATVTGVTLAPSADTISVGDTLRLTASATDAGGNDVGGADYTWTSDTTNIATVDAAGLVTGIAVGSATITATTDSVSGTAQITVEATTGTGYDISILYGQDQTGPPDVELDESLEVEVRDTADSSLVQGVTVTFVPDAGHGSVDPTTAVTDGTGWAFAYWTLGPNLGPQRLVAKIPGDSVVFSATAEAAPTEGPNLYVENVTVSPAEPTTTDSITVTFVIGNDGTEAVSDSFKVYVEAYDYGMDDTYRTVDLIVSDSIPVAGSITRTVALAPFVEGEYDFIVDLDPDDDISELDEDDNFGYSEAFTVTGS